MLLLPLLHLLRHQRQHQHGHRHQYGPRHRNGHQSGRRRYGPHRRHLILPLQFPRSQTLNLPVLLNQIHGPQMHQLHLVLSPHPHLHSQSITPVVRQAGLQNPLAFPKRLQAILTLATILLNSSRHLFRLVP